MLSPLLVIVFMLIAYFYSSFILKNRKSLYILVWGILALEILLRNMPFMQPFVRGYIGYAFLFTVAITGALNPKWKLSKRLMSVRAAYSIFGFIILSAHPIFYLSEILSGVRAIPWYGVSAYVIMIPLWLTSYLKIRVKMAFKDWKNLQRMAYFVYALMFIHLITQASTPQNKIVAILMAILYGVFKTIHTVYWRKKKS